MSLHPAHRSMQLVDIAGLPWALRVPSNWVSKPSSSGANVAMEGPGGSLLVTLAPYAVMIDPARLDEAEKAVRSARAFVIDKTIVDIAGQPAIVLVAQDVDYLSLQYIACINHGTEARITFVLNRDGGKPVLREIRKIEAIPNRYAGVLKSTRLTPDKHLSLSPLVVPDGWEILAGAKEQPINLGPAPNPIGHRIAAAGAMAARPAIKDCASEGEYLRVEVFPADPPVGKAVVDAYREWLCSDVLHPGESLETLRETTCCVRFCDGPAIRLDLHCPGTVACTLASYLVVDELATVWSVLYRMRPENQALWAGRFQAMECAPAAT